MHKQDEGKNRSDEIDIETGEPVVEEQPGYVPTVEDVKNKGSQQMILISFSRNGKKKKEVKKLYEKISNAESSIEDLLENGQISMAVAHKLSKQLRDNHDIEHLRHTNSGGITLDIDLNRGETSQTE